MTGIELAAVLGKERPETKVPLISGTLGEEGEEVPSAVSFPAKPFLPEKLQQTIVKLVPPEAQKLVG